MRYSNSQPSLPADNALTDAGAWVLVIAVGLIPLFWLPGFHSGFEVPRQALVLVVMGPIAALLLARNWAQRAFARVPVLLLFAVIAAGLVAQLRGGFDLNTAWRSLRYLAPIIVLILSGAALMHPRFAEPLRLALVLPAIPVLAIGLLRRLYGVFSFLPDNPEVSISSTLGNSNALGEAFAPVFLAGLVFAPAMQARAARMVMWIGTACALALVVISHSRGAQLAAAAGLAVQAALWCWSRKHDRDVMLRVLVAFLILVTVAGVFLGLPMGAGARDYLRSFWSTTAPTNMVRLSIWGGTVEMIGDSFPLGAGLGRFEAAFLPHRRAAEWHLSGVDTRVDNPHQEFLWIVSETGILGGAALLLLLIVALRRATRPEDDLSPMMRAPQRALLLTIMALLVLSLVRAPLHHPSGVLVFAALIGSVAPRKVRPGWILLDLLIVPFLGAFLVLASVDAKEDYDFGCAIEALNDGKAALSQGDHGSVASLLQESGRGLRTTGSDFLKDFDRTFRASLAAGELADLKDAVRDHVPPEACAAFPDQKEVAALLDEVLRLCPNHPGATNQLALLWLRQGFVARAETMWEDAIRALPEAPRFRHNLALLHQQNDRFADAFHWMQQEIRRKPEPSPDDEVMLAALSLGLGREAATFGRYLAPTGGSPVASPTRSVAATGTRSERRRTLLLHLLEDPADGQSLADLAEIDYALGAAGTGSPDLLSEANRAYSRSRVRYAIVSLETGDLVQAENFLRLAVQKDGNLLDALFLRAKVAARANRKETVIDSLRALLDRAVPRASVSSWIQRDPDLGTWLADGRLGELAL